MAQALIPEIKLKKPDVKGVKFVMGQKLETTLILFDRAVTFLKGGDYQRAAFLGLVCSVIAGRHYKTRPRDAAQALLVSEGIVRAAVAHAELPPALEYLANDFTSRCQDDDGMPCLGISPEAQAWISKKIRILIHEGYPIRQAAAIAFSMARKRGYRIPRPGVGERA